MPKHVARRKAVAQAIDQLRGLNLAERCERLGLPMPQNNVLAFRAFATDYELSTTDFLLHVTNGRDAAKPEMHILVLHYLLHEALLAPSDNLISFREFPGGPFYHGPFRKRSVDMLAKRMGNDLECLRAHLDRFDWDPVDKGDLAARVHCIGPLHVTLVYHRGDEEFGPAANLLFDQGFAQAFDTEDAAVVASKVCFGLL
ncbi:MAG: DUF3786 domain-containing protein [Pirellulaceae bacterium]